MAVLPRFAKWSNRRDDSCVVIDAFDVGTGGGFYVDAIRPRWSAAPAKRYPMLHQRRSSNTSLGAVVYADVSLRWSKLRQHQQLILAATHGEGVATYHGSMRQNGDHWAVSVGVPRNGSSSGWRRSIAGDGSATDHGRGNDPGFCRIRADRRRRGGVL